MIANQEALLGQATKTTVRAGHLERDKILHWLGLGFALSVSAVLNLWNLAQNGYGNTYYAVAVQSMLQNWHNFFFASYDAGGFITVDKPPVALWIQAISAKIFGFSGLSLLLPEALAGVASVALVYFLVRRIFGTPAAFIAAMAMALTPIAAAIERTNNTDTWLLFTLLLAAWAITKAAEKGRLGMLLLSMALVGVAFNVKMLAAWVVLPTFYLLYLVAAPLKWPKRLLHLALATLVVVPVSLSWAVAVDLTPAAQRPYVGGSQTNSVLELALGYNGLGRVTGQGERIGGGAGRGSAPPASLLPQGFQGTGGAQPPSGTFANNGGPAGGSGGTFNTGQPGALRLFNSQLADQWSWLFPLAAFGLLGAVSSVRLRGTSIRRLLSEAKARLPHDRRVQAVILWGGWLATYGVVFSMASGIFHTYYLVMLAPALGALVGMGMYAMWMAFRRGKSEPPGEWGGRTWLLPAALVGTAAWQVKLLVVYSEWSVWLTPILLGGSFLSAIPLVATRLLTKRVWRRLSPALIGVGVVALLLAPAAWALTPALASANSTLPSAGPSLLSAGGGGFGGQAQPGEQANSGLISYLQANRNGYFYLVAVSSANQASSIALSTGQPVLAMGGFTGSDPAMTVEKLQQLVATKQVRYVLTGGGGMGGNSSAVDSWIQANGTVVDSSLYGGQTGSLTGGPGGFGGGGTLYDLAGK